MQQDRYKTILVMVMGLLIIAWIFNLELLAKIAIVIGTTCALIPVVAKWVDWLWLKFAYGLGYVNSRILLSVIYFVFLLPIAWIARLFTKDPLMLKARNAPSVYTQRDHTYTKEDLENIW